MTVFYVSPYRHREKRKSFRAVVKTVQGFPKFPMSPETLISEDKLDKRVVSKQLLLGWHNMKSARKLKKFYFNCKISYSSKIFNVDTATELFEWGFETSTIPQLL